MSKLTREQHDLLVWFVRAHQGGQTKPKVDVCQSNLGLAVSVIWHETVWAWLWLDLDPVEYACGWPEGSRLLVYPRTCRALADYVQIERVRLAS